MDTEKQILIEAFNTAKISNVSGLYTDDKTFNKNSVKSQIARKHANELFAKKNHNEKVHEEIWKLYTESIAYATNKSEELAAGYANRSALLLHLKKYNDCLLEIDRALKIADSNALKVKLFCRQAACFVALQEGKQTSSMKKAKFWLNKVEDDNEKANLIRLIGKAESVIEDNVLDSPEIENKNDLSYKNDAVSISYDKKFGRKLVATRDIEPGELVYIEEFYAVSVNRRKLHAYCSHCLGISWALIPCDSCAYYLYCSEKCKQEAWQKYHDIECLMKCITLYNDMVFTYIVELSVRSIIMGIKEAGGSFQKLRNLLNEVDKYGDLKAKGFFENGKFSNNSFVKLYSLKHSKNAKKLKTSASLVIPVMQSFASLCKNTGIFEKKIVYFGDGLEGQEDVTFVGCLLMRLVSILFLNSFNVQFMSEYLGPAERSLEIPSYARGTHVCLVTSLINHSCDNNVNKFYNNDGKVVYYATKPIKANDQIFTAYYLNYTRSEKYARQDMLSSIFELKCDCIACRQNWPNALKLGQIDKATLKYPAKYNDLISKIMKKNEAVMGRLSKENVGQFSRKEIQSLAKDIATLDTVLTKPNPIITSYLRAFTHMMEKRYFEVLEVPNACSSKDNY